MRNIRKFGACAVVGGLLSLALSLSPAEATNVACDDPTAVSSTNIATSQALHDPVGPCQGHGLVITGSNITVDLAGHAVIGDGNVTQQHCGILFAAGVSGSIIIDSSAGKTGVVTGFNSGVCMLSGSSGNTVDGITIEANLGIIVPVAPLNNIRGEGVLIEDSDGNTVRNSKIIGNGPHANVHIVGDSDNNTVDNNFVAAGAGPDWSPVANHGIRHSPTAGGSPDSNTTSDNTVTGNLIDGISVFQSTGTGPTGNQILRNLVESNRRDGIRLFMVIQSGTHTCPPGTGTAGHCSGSANSNTVEDNVVCGNVGDGIAVYGHDNTIDGNYAGSLHPKGTAGATAPPAPAGGTGPCLPNGANGSGKADLFDRHGVCTENDWLSNNVTSATLTNPACIT